MYIEVLTFSAWEAQQNPEKVMKWGSAKLDGPLVDNEAKFSTLEEETKRMFYLEYYSKIINAQFVTA